MKEERLMAMQRWRPFGSRERWEPFRNLSDIQGEMNRLFETSSADRRPRPDRRANVAAGVDMPETKDELVLTVELPGMTRQGRFGLDHR